MTTTDKRISVGVDVGGTFTDVVGYDSATGEFRFSKALTSAKPERAIIMGIRNLGFKNTNIGRLVHTTTLATNSLLTHSGLAKAALVTNRGFRDILEIGRQRRPELYDLRTRRPDPLIPRRHRFMVGGRILSDGSELEPLDMREARRVAADILKLRFESVAVCFLNSYINPKHELEFLSVLRGMGYDGHVSLSSEVDRKYREFERTSTTVVNAVLSPLISSYVERLGRILLQEGIPSPIHIMASDGSVVTLRHVRERPSAIIESGPAAGVLASRHLARRHGISMVLTFDMGGTTAKAAAVVNGEPDVVYEFEAAGSTHSGRSIKGSGYPVRGPFIDLAEVSSGGGTVAWVDDGGALRIGPRSAGANPGPACYGRGGKEATVTDANVVLGRLSPDHLLGGEMKIRRRLAVEAVRRVAKLASLETEACAQDIIRIANNTMARAISIVSVERGRDPRDFTMLVFGGAGPVHCCDIADELGISRIIVPVHAGLFSAYGLLTADMAKTFSMPVMSTNPDLSGTFAELHRVADAEMKREGLKEYSTVCYAEARYKGQSYELTVKYDGQLRKAFDGIHRRLYGYSSSDEIEVVNAKLKAVVPGAAVGLPSIGGQPTTSPAGWRDVFFGSSWRRTKVLARESLGLGESGRGPCIIEEYDSTLVVNPSWSWKVGDHFTEVTR
jgi:N-methylhydantoinase A